MNADDQAYYIRHVQTYEYDPRDRVIKKTKATPGGSILDTETYVYGVNNNVIEKTVDGAETTYNYDRSRLLSANIGGKQIEKYKYDGFAGSGTEQDST